MKGWEKNPEEVKKQLAQGALFLPECMNPISDVLCGCGDHDLIWTWIVAYLERVERKEGGRPKTAPEAIAIHLLADADWTEHGTNIAYCWLTDTGKEALAFLKKYGSNWEHEHMWVDSTGCCFGNHDKWEKPV